MKGRGQPLSILNGLLANAARYLNVLKYFEGRHADCVSHIYVVYAGQPRIDTR